MKRRTQAERDEINERAKHHNDRCPRCHRAFDRISTLSCAIGSAVRSDDNPAFCRDCVKSELDRLQTWTHP